MEAAKDFSMWLLEQIPAFLWSEPIKYIVSLVLFALIVRVVLKIFNFGKI